jgi:hypothetical protein
MFLMRSLACLCSSILVLAPLALLVDGALDLSLLEAFDIAESSSGVVVLLANMFIVYLASTASSVERTLVSSLAF